MSNSRSSIGQFFHWLTGRRRLHLRRTAREVVTALAMGLLVVLIEMLGRWHASEFFDLASALTLVLAGVVCVSWHHRLRLHWTQRLWSFASACAERCLRLRFEWGLDLRREPPVPRRLPPVLIGAPIALVGLFAVPLAWATLVGGPLRDVAASGSYVVYVAAAAGLWAGLLSVLIVAAFLPVWMIFDMVGTHLAWLKQHARRAAWVISIVYFGLLLAAATTLPIWVAVLLLAAAAVFAAALPWLPGTWYPDCIWRTRGETEVCSLSLGSLFSLQLLIVALLPLVLVAWALGPQTIGMAGRFADSPISTALGHVAAWLAGGGLWVFLSLLAVHMGIARWHDPSRPAPVSVHVSGALNAAMQRRVREQLAADDWQVSFAPRLPQRSDVKIAVGEAADSSGATFAFSREELSDPRSRERIARRDVIQRRRLLVGGLQSIFRSAAGRRGRAGCGFWVAPQYWFVDGLTRDQFDDEDTNVLDVIPPLYYKALPRAARRHFFDVSRALAVDLIFVEDGVGFRGLRRVLRVMFERFDIDGGRQPLSEIHFVGLPKVRVVLHDFDFQQPLMKSKYPEPSYQHLGRVRVLHVFRDRGEDEAQIVEPSEPDHLFTPDDSPVLVR